ncbi:MAG TPA: copper-containing nitrite reductase [Balneolaceae bacterium]|nr:copper-containing nitrite reductase [Balneolaceae bacterium]
MKIPGSEKTFDRKQFLKNAGGALLSGGLLASALPFQAEAQPKQVAKKDNFLSLAGLPTVKRVAADPRNIPAPIGQREPKTHYITIESKEVIAEIEDGVKFKYMTFGGQIPGPMIRVRQGDTINLTFKNASSNTTIHNIDQHAVYGSGGGAGALLCPPGQSRTIKYKTLYPGAFIYHCAVPNMDKHISSGMFGMIVVEPPQGLPKVDHEFYFGQHEVYTDKKAGEEGMHHFDVDAMTAENPTYVLLNGEKHAITDDKYGNLKVKKGETARIFMVTGGPNLTSSFHAIGNVFTKAWRAGALANEPDQYVQTCQVPPGSTGVFELEFPVPETIKLVDHSLSRVVRQGMLGKIEVEGSPEPDIFSAKG